MFFKDYEHLSPNINDNAFLITEKFKKFLRKGTKEQLQDRLKKKEARLKPVQDRVDALQSIVMRPKPSPDDPVLGQAGLMLPYEQEREYGHLRDISKIKEKLREKITEDFFSEEWLAEAGYRKAMRNPKRTDREVLRQHHKEVSARDRARAASEKIKPAMDAGDVIGAGVARSDYRMEKGTEEAHQANIENLAKNVGSNFWGMMQDAIPTVQAGMARERSNKRKNK